MGDQWACVPDALVPIVVPGVDGYRPGAVEPYTLNTWQYIDLFVYFTHWRFTVPPPMWTDAAHRHGVPVSLRHAHGNDPSLAA